MASGVHDPDAYQEASCTAMFAVAFSRGVRLGWLSKPERYIQASIHAWEGLTRMRLTPRQRTWCMQRFTLFLYSRILQGGFVDCCE